MSLLAQLVLSLPAHPPGGSAARTSVLLAFREVEIARHF